MFSLVTLSTIALALVHSAAANDKRGIAFPASNPAGDLSKAGGAQASWVYNWSPNAPSNNPGLTFIPMQWGSADIGSLAATVKTLGAKTVLGFNEPDMSAQSNISPTDAANLWKQYIQPLKANGVALGAPAVSSSEGSQTWLTNFINACGSTCTFDFVPVHWYGDGAENFENYVTAFHKTFNYPIWVTEFGSTSTDATEVATFLTQTVNWLDQQSYVQKYSWFAFARPEAGSPLDTWLLDASGNVNSLGNSYLTDSS